MVPMSNRYTVTSAWTAESLWGVYLVQTADLTDTRNGSVFTFGAYRVVDTTTGKQVGPVFKGETAWMDAERLASDFAVKAVHS